MRSVGWRGCAGVAAALLSGHAPATASDGVIEINQARAMAGGVNGSLAADPAGFPVAITQSGSYRLTSDLALTNLNTTGISVSADDVTLDLGGFAIRGMGRHDGAGVELATRSSRTTPRRPARGRRDSASFRATRWRRAAT